MTDVINGMFCVSYQIIRNHKECEGVLYAFDESNFSFSFSYWPWAFGGNMKGLMKEGAYI